MSELRCIKLPLCPSVSVYPHSKMNAFWIVNFISLHHTLKHKINRRRHRQLYWVQDKEEDKKYESQIEREDVYLKVCSNEDQRTMKERKRVFVWVSVSQRARLSLLALRETES